MNPSLSRMRPRFILVCPNAQQEALLHGISATLIERAVNLPHYSYKFKIESTLVAELIEHEADLYASLAEKHVCRLGSLKPLASVSFF
jgi:hypothetical protein